MNRVEFKLSISPYWWLTRTAEDIGPVVYFALGFDDEFETAAWFVARHTLLPIMTGTEI